MTGPTFATNATTPTAPPKAPKPATRPGEKPDDGAGMRVFIYLKLHWLMIAFCGTLLGGAGALAAWELLASKYESYGMLQVSSVPTTLANQNNPQQARTDFLTYLKTLSALVKSEFVLNAALRDMKDLPTIKAQKNPTKYLDEELVVSWTEGSEVIRITFRGHEPEDAKRIVDAVQKAFIEQVVERKAHEMRDFLVKVEESQLKIKKILEAKAPKPTVPGAPGVVHTGGVGPVVPPAPGAGLPPVPGLLPQDIIDRANPSILINEIVARRREVEQLPLTISDYKRREAVLREKLEAIQKSATPKLIEDMIDKDQDVVTAKIRANISHREWKRIESTSNPPYPPAVVELKAAYEADEKRWAELRAEKLKTYEGARRLEEAKKVATELEEIIRTIQRHQEQLNLAKESRARAEKRLMDLPIPTDKSGNPLTQVKFEDKHPYQTDDSDLQTIDSVYRRLILQQQLLKLEVESPPRVTILQPASAPTQKDTKKQAMGTAFAGILGFVLMVLGVIGYETMSRRVSSLADVKSSVPVPVVGVIPCVPNDTTAAGAGGRDPVKRAAANEAIDKLRAYVSQTWLSRGATTIAVTSPIADEGKAFAAFGLASSLAQAGYKTLVVDFDLREPALHSYAGVPNLAGVCELLRAETDMRSAVQFLPSGLHLLTPGKWSDEARKAATGDKLEAVLAKMKEPYDCVVIHGHALLTVAESVEVARRCEVVLVCAKYRETATPLLKRAAERIATMEIPYSGVVYIGSTDGEALC